MSSAELSKAKRQGEHCVVGGFDESFVELVKAQLRDPNSFEHIETRIDPVGSDGRHVIGMHFRSRNGFGGMNDMYAVGKVDDETCAAELTALG